MLKSILYKNEDLCIALQFFLAKRINKFIHSHSIVPGGLLVMS